MECRDAPDGVELIVMAPGLPEMTAVAMLAQPLNPPGACVTREVYVWLPPVGRPIETVVSAVVSLTTMISPLAGVKLGVTTAAELTAPLVTNSAEPASVGTVSRRS